MAIPWSGRRQAPRLSDRALEVGFFAAIGFASLEYISRKLLHAFSKVNDGILIFS